MKYATLFVVMLMISYQPFYETLFQKGITEYYLIFKQGVTASTLHQMEPEAYLYHYAQHTV